MHLQSSFGLFLCGYSNADLKLSRFATKQRDLFVSRPPLHMP